MMLKKVLLATVCLLSSLFVLFMYIKSDIIGVLNAQSAPVFTLPKGSKVVLGKYNNKEIVRSEERRVGKEC